MNDLNTLIQEAIDKSGCDDFALLYFGYDGHWLAMVGSPRHVMLGEAPGKYEAEGATGEKAVSALIAVIKKAARKTMASHNGR